MTAMVIRKRFTKSSQQEQQKSTSTSLLLGLPFDIRLQIWHFLFPEVGQLYLQSFPDHKLQCTLPLGTTPVPLSAMLVCRSLQVELSEYLYNSYLFNVIGEKRDCLANYERVERVINKYACGRTHVNAFSNGVHSRTMCISLWTGEVKSQVVEQRARGEKMSLDDARREVNGIDDNRPSFHRTMKFWLRKATMVKTWIRSVVFAVLIGIAALLLVRWPVLWRAEVRS